MPWPKPKESAEKQKLQLKTKKSEFLIEDIRAIANILVNEVLSGKPKSRLVVSAMQKFGISQDLAQVFIDDVFNVVRDDVLFEIDREKDLALIKRADLYEKAYEVSDYKLCLEILRDRDKLRGLYASDGTQSEDVLNSLISGLNITAAKVIHGALPKPEEFIEGETGESVQSDELMESSTDVEEGFDTTSEESEDEE